MGKKIILSIGLSMILVSSLLAFGHGGFKKGGNKGGIIKTIMHLDLSDAQKTKIKTIMQDKRKNTPNMHSAFSETSFDEAQFIQLSNERKNNKIENMAKSITKIYNLLDASQKKKLKEILNSRDKMKQEGNCGGKNCNGRGRY